MWASGVLLFVMLVGTFPFEMEDENYVNTAGLYSIWIQQIRCEGFRCGGVVDPMPRARPPAATEPKP